MKTLEPLSKNVPIIPLLYLGSYLEMFGKKVFISEAGTISEIKKEIESFSPHIVGVTATTSQIEQAFEVAHMVKEIDPHMITVGGGPHMTFRYEDALSHEAFDVVVRGAGEHPLHELSEAHPLTTIPGIGFRIGDSIVSSPPPMLSSADYNTYPPPAYYLLRDLNRYRKNVLLISSRGCPFQCSMCASSHMWGNNWISQHPETMISHLEAVLSQFHGINPVTIRYYDDMFTVDKKRIQKFYALLREKEISISFKCESRVDTFDDEIAVILKKSGCTEVFFGIESGNQQFLDVIDKRITLQQVTDAVRIAHRHDLSVCGAVMIGYPRETLHDIRKTISFVKELHLERMQLSILTPFPGTTLFKEAEKQGWIRSTDWNQFDGTCPVMHIDGNLEEDLTSLIKEGYFSFYLDPRYVLRQIRRGQLIRGGYGTTIIEILFKYLSTLF
ncbi:MAG: cobalamin B12-binding domain-containing protein [Theionarchaea archaeon]|nr:cobalamin B12-binding domain-containing protein [Theionarchaea archaeon]